MLKNGNPRGGFYMTHRYTQMNPLDALYTAARAYPGGIEALAHRMGVSVAVLRNKLAPHVNTHHVTLAEASLIIEFLREAKCDEALLPLQALNWQHGLIAYCQTRSTCLMSSSPSRCSRS
jgi:hypothetical protein